LLYDHQAQAEATPVRASLHERLKEPPRQILRHPSARIFDLEQDAVVHEARADAHHAAIPSELDGVGDQVGQCRDDQLAIDTELRVIALDR
jgi:hypothetical protein